MTNSSHTALGTAVLGGFMIPVSLAAAPLEMGSSAVDITPDPGFRSAGGYREVISTAVNDPLFAKAMVLRQGEVEAALVVCDLSAVYRTVTNPARQKASAATGIPVENIVVAATHTHGGPEYCGTLYRLQKEKAAEKGESDPHEPWSYQAALIDRIAEAVTAAQSALRPVDIAFGETELPGIVHNRRFLMRDGSVRFNPKQNDPAILSPAGPVDESLPVLGFHDPKNGKPVASFTTFDMHVATFGGTEFGADFPGVLQAELRSQFGDGFFSLFGEGTAGDTNHVPFQTDRPKPTYREIGKAMAEQVISVFPELEPLPGPRLAVASRIVPLPFIEITPSEIQRSEDLFRERFVPHPGFPVLVGAWRTLNTQMLRERDGDHLQAEVQAIQLSADTAIVTLPHEIFTELGDAIEKHSPYKHTFIVTLANDIDFYIATEKAYAEGSYEIETSSVKPGSGETLVNGAVSLLLELKSQNQK